MFNNAKNLCVLGVLYSLSSMVVFSIRHWKIIDLGFKNLKHELALDYCPLIPKIQMVLFEFWSGSYGMSL